MTWEHSGLLVNCMGFICLSHTCPHFVTNTTLTTMPDTLPQDSLPPDPRSHSGLCPGSLSGVRRLRGSFTICTVLIRFSLCSESRLQSRSDHRGCNQGDQGSMSPAQLHDLVGRGPLLLPPVYLQKQISAVQRILKTRSPTPRPGLAGHSPGPEPSPACHPPPTHTPTGPPCAQALALATCPERAGWPGITDNTIRGQDGSILPGERNEVVRRGAWGRRP